MIRIFEASRTILGVDLSVRLVRFASQSHRVILPALLILMTLVVCLSAGSSQAVPINYGSFMGDTTIYTMVQEDTNSVGDAPPKFGPPTVLGIPTPPAYPAVPCVMCDIPGDSLDFTPVGFSASATGAGGVDVTDGNLAFMAESKPGFSLANIKFTEFGDTTLAGFGASTFTSVTMNGFINIQAVDDGAGGVMGVNVFTIPFAMSFAPSGGFFAGAPQATIWMGMAFVDLTSANPLIAAGLAAQGKDPNLAVKKISVDLDNTLIAISQAGTFALIAKKDHVIITTNIPEPTSCLLAMFGLLAGVMVSRRSR